MLPLAGRNGLKVSSCRCRASAMANVDGELDGTWNRLGDKPRRDDLEIGQSPLRSFLDLIGCVGKPHHKRG